MRKKIALMTYHYDSCIQRAMCFIKHGSDYDIELVFFFEYHNEEIHVAEKIDQIRQEMSPFSNVKVSLHHTFSVEDFDLVLPMTDKLGSKWLNLCYPGITNLNDKRVLQQEILKFGKLNYLKSNATHKLTDFQDSDDVIMKPTIASGSWSDNPKCYQKIKFDEVKEFFFDTNFVIQDYVDSENICMISYMSDGTELIMYDITEQECKKSPSGNFYFSHMLTGLKFKDKYPDLVELGKQFLCSAGYKNVRTIYNIQYLLTDQGAFMIDVNLRCGPVVVAIELKELFTGKIFKNGIHFLMGENQVKEELTNLDTYVGYQLFAVDMNTSKPLTNKVIDINMNTAISITENKNSGVFRNDVQVFIQPQQ